MKAVSFLLLAVLSAGPALGATIVSTEDDRRRISERIGAIRAQVRDIDKSLKSGALESTQFQALQELRTNLEQERKLLAEREELLKNIAGLMTYETAVSTPAAGGVAVSSGPAVSLWEAGGWARFEGVLPCAGCDGIKTTLTLYNDGLRFALIERYLGPDAPKRVFESDGLWTTLRGHGDDPDATVFELDYDKPGKERHFLRLSDNEIKLVDLDESKLKRKPNLLLKRVAP